MSNETEIDRIDPFEHKVYTKLTILKELPDQIRYLEEELNKPGIADSNKQFVQRMLGNLRKPTINPEAGQFKDSTPN